MDRRVLTVCALLTLVCGVGAGAEADAGLEPADPEAPAAFHEHFGPGAAGPFVARNAMVAASSHHATMAGLEILRAGGNAFDAMAAVQFTLNVAEPYASGIGGGLFMVAYDAASGEVVALDGREEAPRAFQPDAFLDEDGGVVPFRERATGGSAVGVPGTLAAVAYAVERHGSMTLAETLRPAIRLARDGFIVTAPFARNVAAHWDRIERYPATEALFSGPDGGPLQAGDRFANPELADTLERIAEEGVAAFYEGPIAEAIVRAVQDDPSRPGVMTLEDLANYRAVLREPVSVAYRGHDVYGMNMPTSGGTTLGLMLNILEETDFADAAFGSPRAIHRLVDAQNLAFADRNAYMADADFADIPTAGLLDKAYARERSGLLDPDAALDVPAPAGTPPGVEMAANPEGREEAVSTTHFTIVDRDRNVVALTSTIEQHFGSAVTVPGWGFLLNNELTDFDADPYTAEGALVPNAPEGGWRLRRTALGAAAETEGGKRPRSSMTPTLVLRDGAPRLALGSPGGSRIIGVTLNVLTNVIDRGMDVQAAINAPRVVGRNGPAELEAPWYEHGTLRGDLEGRGFAVEAMGAAGSVQAIEIGGDGWLRGGADPRREGLAAGY